jgi:hypothetical protein
MYYYIKKETKTMEENIITTEQVVETAEDIITAADSDVIKAAVKGGLGVVTGLAVGYAIVHIYRYFKNKKQQNEASADDQVDVESSESAE